MSHSSPIVTAYQALLSKGRLSPNPAQVALVNQLGSLQEILLNRSRAPWTNHWQAQNGVYIYGGVGTGKSRIADLFALTLPESVTKKRIHFHEFMADVHVRLHHARSKADFKGDPLIQIGRQIQSQTSVLCFDEFQVSDIADAMILKRLFTSFWQAGGVMVSTSNRHPDQLYLNGLNRPLFIPFIKELQQRCLIWKLDGTCDYRMNNQDHLRVAVFFTDHHAFRESLSRSIEGSSLQTIDIEVLMNRSIRVQAARPALASADDHRSQRQVVYSTFSALCEASLGSSDYHALCNFGETIFLEGLRQFSITELDYVRRFITLIDIAYEARSRVICFSNVALDEVFRDVGFGPDSTSTNHTKKHMEPLSANSSSGNTLSVRAEGGSSSSMMSTFVSDVEWSATGLIKASLATGGAGETDVRFAIGRTISRLTEMGSSGYAVGDDQ